MDAIMSQVAKRTAEGGASAAKSKKSNSKAECQDKDVMRLLTRDYLAHKSEAKHFLTAKSLVMIVKDEALQQQLVHLAQHFEDSKPEVTDQHKKEKKFPPHPSGMNRKQTFMFSGAMIMVRDVLKDIDPDNSKRAEALQQQEVSLKDQFAACFRSRFNTPKDKRNWKFDWVISDFVPDVMRLEIITLVSTMKDRSKITLEPARVTGQPDSEAALWSWLKKQPK